MKSLHNNWILGTFLVTRRRSYRLPFTRNLRPPMCCTMTENAWYRTGFYNATTYHAEAVPGCSSYQERLERQIIIIALAPFVHITHPFPFLIPRPSSCATSFKDPIFTKIRQRLLSLHTLKSSLRAGSVGSDIAANPSCREICISRESEKMSDGVEVC